MRTILIPIDGSLCALRAVELVVARRQRYSRPDDLAIHLVNIQPPLPHDVTRFASHQQVAAKPPRRGRRLTKLAFLTPITMASAISRRR